MISPYTDQSFDSDKTKQYDISIQISLDGFSFLVSDPPNNQVVAFKREILKISSESFLAPRLKEWIDSEPLMHKQYHHVNILYQGHRFSLVPQELLLQSKPDLPFNLLHENRSSDQIIKNNLDPLKQVLLFSIPKKLKNELENQYESLSFYHPLRQFAQDLPGLHKESEYGMVLHFELRSFFLLLYSRNQIHFMNYYTYLHENDIIYFVLTTLKQLHATISKTELQLSGVISSGDKSEVLLSRYFNEIHFLRPITNLQYNPSWFNNDIQQFVVHFYR